MVDYHFGLTIEYDVYRPCFCAIERTNADFYPIGLDTHPRADDRCIRRFDKIDVAGVVPGEAVVAVFLGVAARQHVKRHDAGDSRLNDNCWECSNLRSHQNPVSVRGGLPGDATERDANCNYCGNENETNENADHGGIL